MHKLVLAATVLAFLFVTVSFTIVLADVSVGVKQGDWIQYNVHVTGNPPGDHNIQSASMNVTNVEGADITLDIQTIFNNGTNYPEHITLNLATGILGDDFFIPKNLNVGDQFYDAYQGNITITSQQTQEIAGAQRTVILGSSNYTNYTWDKETGTLVAGLSVEPDYRMTTRTVATDISAQTSVSPQNHRLITHRLLRDHGGDSCGGCSVSRYLCPLDTTTQTTTAAFGT